MENKFWAELWLRDTLKQKFSSSWASRGCERKSKSSPLNQPTLNTTSFYLFTESEKTSVEIWFMLIISIVYILDFARSVLLPFLHEFYIAIFMVLNGWKSEWKTF